MKRTALIAAVIASTTLLTACQLRSDEWHVGHCAAGQLSAAGQTAHPHQITMAFRLISVSHGMSLNAMIEGFNDYVPETNYSESCKVSRRLGV
jgi:hypothetical protein